MQEISCYETIKVHSAMYIYTLPYFVKFSKSKKTKAKTKTESFESTMYAN